MKKILTGFIILAIVIGAFLVWRSDKIEREHNRVEITVDFDDLTALAERANLTPQAMMAELKELGVTAIGMREASVERYRQEGLLAVHAGGELLNAWHTTGVQNHKLNELLAAGKVSPTAVYLTTGDKDLAERLAHKAGLKLERPVNLYVGDNSYVVEITESKKRVEQLRIGLDERDLESALVLGLRIVPRIDNGFLDNAAAVEETLAEFLTLPTEALSAVIFEGEEVTGNPAYLDLTARMLKEAGVSFGIVEYNPRQEGALKLAALTDYATVLVHSNFPRENVHNIVNSVQERRVRLLYVRMDTNAPNFYQKGTELIAAVAEKIDELGYTTGPATAFATPKQGRVLILLMLLGVAAAGTLLLAEIFGQYHKLFWLVLAVAFLGLGGLFVVFSHSFALQLSSILAAMIFSSLAVVTQQLNRLPEEKLETKAALGFAFTTLVRTFLILLGGGLVVLGLTSSPLFTSGVPLFRGVKLVHLLPLVLVAVVCVKTVMYGHVKKWTVKEAVAMLREIWKEPLVLGYMLVLAVLAVVGYIYVGRTGHTAGIPVLDLEQKLRIVLGNLLIVRPRFKEFLIGYPLAFLGLVLAAKGYRKALTAALLTFGGISAVAVVNTFMHFTTPGYNTLLRSFHGLWLGIIFGLLYTFCLFVLLRLWERIAK